MSGRRTMTFMRRVRHWIAPTMVLLASAGDLPGAAAETRLEGQIRQDQVWEEELSPYRITDALTIEKGAAVTIPPGVVVLFEKGGRLEVEGVLMADQAVFDGLEDIYDRERMQFHPGSRGRLNHCVVQDLALDIRTSEALITSSVISNRNGCGITVDKASRPTITRNDFLGNSYYALYREGPDILPAPNNYWGAASGPSGAGSGEGDAVNPSIDFIPFATADMGEHLVLVETRLGHTVAGPGSRLTLTYVIANLNSFDHAAILGASIYSDSEHHMHSPAHDLKVTIQPGRHRLTRAFTIPANASPGRYTVLWGVMKSDLSAYYAIKKDVDILNVGASPTAAPAPVEMPGWVPLRKGMPY